MNRVMKIGIAVLFLPALLTGCITVTLVEPYDETIDKGATAYQEALEKFVIETTESYKACLGRDGAACEKASYSAQKDAFYNPQTAKLLVLKTRAQSLDSLGLCASVFEFASSLSKETISDPQIRGWVAPFEEGAPVPQNCTEIQVDTVLKNHALMASVHEDLETKPAEEAASQVVDRNALGLFRDTLVQNIKILLFVENAKKRGE